MTTSRPTYKTFIFDHKWHAKAIGFLVGVLMIAIYTWIAAGFVSLMTHLYEAFNTGWSHGAEGMIKDVVVILASLELIRIFQSYLLLGRVKVTFILDVTLVVLIGELISFWYRDEQLVEMLVSVLIVSILVFLRIITTRHSPDTPDHDADLA